MEEKRSWWPYVATVCRVLTGLVFVYSGFVKAVDPLGSAYKFADYFTAYNLGFLEPGSLFFSILLSAAEFTIGAALLFSIRVKLATWGALLFIALFLPLTLVSALTNKVSDCGCFGDALKLSNWETFWKNVVLLVPILLAFFQRKKHRSRLPWGMEWGLVFLMAGISVFGSFYGLRHLPVLDFRPYKVGVNIAEGMKIPEGAPQDEYQISAIYQKDGVKKEFPYPDFPDSTWTWVETINVLIKKGYEPPIHNFSLNSLEGLNLTEKILSDSGITLLVMYHDLEKAKLEKQKEINDLALFAMSKNIPFYGVTGSGEEVIRSFEKSAETSFPFLQADETTLKTIIRSNPGLVILQGGTIVGQWASADIPALEELKNKDLLAYSVTRMKAREARLVWIGGLLVLLVLGAGIGYLKKSCRIQEKC